MKQRGVGGTYNQTVHTSAQVNCERRARNRPHFNVEKPEGYQRLTTVFLVGLTKNLPKSCGVTKARR